MKIKFFVLVLLSLLPIAAEAQYGRPYFSSRYPVYRPYGPYYPAPLVRRHYIPGPFYPVPRVYGYARPVYPYPYPYSGRSYAKSGIKFTLDRMSKNDRAAIEDGKVFIPDANGKLGYIGTVRNFSEGFHSAPLLFTPGTREFAISLDDKRTFRMSAIVQPGRVTEISLRSSDFSEPTPPPTHK
jgi:hypothetical protein